MCTTDSQLSQNTFTFEEACAKQHMPTDQRTCATYFCPLVWIHPVPFEPLHTDTFGYQYKLRKNMNLASFSCSTHLMYITKISSMDATHYWPFDREYTIWNAAVAALQLWTEDLKPHILSDAIERVYTAFFCSNSAQQLRNISEEVLFSHIVTTLNDTFEWELAQADDGYESESKSLNIPTPLWGTPHQYDVSANENLSFNPGTPLTTVHPHPAHSPQRLSNHNPVCHHLTFGSSDDENPSTDSGSLHGMEEHSSPAQQHMLYYCTDDALQDRINEEEEEDFPTAPLNDGVWLEVLIPVHTAWICHHSLQNIPHYHTMRWWTSMTSQISKMWWQPPVMKTSLIWMMVLDFEHKIFGLDKHLYSLAYDLKSNTKQID